MARRKKRGPGLPQSTFTALTVLKLRAQHFTWEEICTATGLSRGGAQAAYKRALKHAGDYSVMVATHNERLEMLGAKLWGLVAPDAGPPDLEAVDRYLKVLERQAKLLGLDAGTKGGFNIDVNVDIDNSRTEVTEAQVLIDAARYRELVGEVLPALAQVGGTAGALAQIAADYQDQRDEAEAEVEAEAKESATEAMVIEVPPGWETHNGDGPV